MQDLIAFAILGMGIGSVYVLLGHGLVLVYRGAAVVNFAHGGFALVAAFIYFDLSDQQAWPRPAAVFVAVVVTAVLAGLVHVAIMRPLRTSSPLARVIATLGVLIVLQTSIAIRYDVTPRQVGGILPAHTVHVLGTAVSSDRLWLVGIAVFITAMLWALTRLTRFGLAMQATAENRRAAAALGWSPDLVATVTWALGGGLAAVAGILVVPLTGLQITTLTGLVIAAMAAALLAGFRSPWLVLAGGMGIGIVQSEVGRFVSVQGLATALPFLVILIVIVMRGSGLPLRDTVVERRPEVGTGRIRLGVVIPLVVGLGVASQVLFEADLNSILTITCIVSVLLLSIVVLTGYAGQLSLAQYAIAGIGAWFAGRSVAALDWPFELALVVGVLGAVLVGLLFALPALRTRGVNLAVVTLGLGVSVQAVLLANSDFTGGFAGTVVGPQTFFGWSVDPIATPENYALFCLIFLTLAALMVANVRRSGLGRRMLAVRTNERAAASLGVGVFGTKMFAFAMSSGLAGLAGVLLAFTGHAVTYDTTFDPFLSITAVTFVVLGGVGFIAGPILGSTLAPGGAGTLVTEQFPGVDASWMVLAGGVVFLLILLQDPNGMVRGNLHMFERVTSRFRGSGGESRMRSARDLTESVEPVKRPQATLVVRGLSVRYGSVAAVQDVDLRVAPGEIVGLIGANGAGKTSVIDALTGFARSTGSVHLGDLRLDSRSAHRRARAGLSRTFQSLELFDDVSVRENLLTAASERSFAGTMRDLVWPQKQHLQAPAVAALRELRLLDDLDKRPSDLPFGRRRLVAIARALASGPAILLLDEPAAGLDDTETKELTVLLRRLADEWGIGILLVEHDMSLVMSVCDNVTALDFGRVIANGSPAEIKQHDGVRRAYLGEAESSAMN